MTEWVFILVLLVFPIVLLFQFVGCARFGEPADPEVEKPPRYRDYIMEEPSNPGSVKNNKVVPRKADVIAYWRLVDAATVAADEKRFKNGEYRTVPSLPPVEANPTYAGSEAASGGFFTGQTGLIVSDPAAPCRIFNGGHVLVPFEPGMYTDEFTIEAWIDARWTQLKGYDHTLFDAGGRYSRPFDVSPSYHGFRIFANREDRWQVILYPSVVGMNVLPIVVHGARTHLAVTVEHDATTGKKKVTMFVNGKVSGLGVANYYSPPKGAPLFIGVSNRTVDPSNPPEPRNPVLSLIQEVVLHSKALSPDEIENHFDINR